MQVRTALRLSIATAVATIAIKSLAWWITGSVGLLSDAMESFVNLASAPGFILFPAASRDHAGVKGRDEGRIDAVAVTSRRQHVRS